MDPTLTRLIQLESEGAYRAEPDPGCDEFSIVPGSIPVLLSAPHGAAHFRNNSLKEEDEYTAGLVRLVAERTGAHALYAFRKSTTDPNYYPNTSYKRAMQHLTEQHPIHFVLDIHGCSPDRKFGIALGTMHNRSCPAQRPVIIRTLAHHGFSETSHGLLRLDVDRTFPANGNEHIETVTQFVFNRLGISAAQIELNAHLRIVQRLPGVTSRAEVVGEPESILRIIAALTDLVENLKNA